MIEVKAVKYLRKGALLAVCNVCIVPWKMTLKDVKILQKGNERWVGMPSKETVRANGEKFYQDTVEFEQSAKKRLQDKILEEFDKANEQPAEPEESENFIFEV